MRIRYLLCALALSLIYGLPEFSCAEEKVHVAVSNFSASYIPMYLAQKRGFYAEEGLRAELILMAGLTSTRALIGNSVDLARRATPPRRSKAPS